MSEATRTLMFVVIGTIIITSAVWQALGFALARLENFIIPVCEAGKARSSLGSTDGQTDD
jgi:hypothetical protein